MTRTKQTLRQYKENTSHRRNQFKSNMISKKLAPTYATLEPTIDNEESFSETAEANFQGEFALSENRDSVLKHLVPDSPDFHYYHALHLLNLQSINGKSECHQVILGHIAALKRQGDPRVKLLQCRLHLLKLATGEANDQVKEAGSFFIQELQLDLQHKPLHSNTLTTNSNVLNHLNNNDMQGETLLCERAQNHLRNCKDGTNLLNLEDIEQGYMKRLIEILLSQNCSFNEEDRNILLDFILKQYPIHLPNISGIIPFLAKKLNAPNAEDFGGYDIHKALLLEQLEELFQLIPDRLLGTSTFLVVYLSKLQSSFTFHPQQEMAFYNSALTFLRKCSRGQNNAKFVILHSTLQKMQKEGQNISKQLFQEYLEIPRRGTSYMNKNFVDKSDHNQVVAFSDTIHSYNQKMYCPPNSEMKGFIHALELPDLTMEKDKKLIEDILSQQFSEKGDIHTEFSTYLDHEFLANVLATCMITSGKGEITAWGPKLGAGTNLLMLAKLKMLYFASQNKSVYHPNDEVKLGIYVKNVESLIVQVYEIDTRSYYMSEQMPISDTISLDGITASEESSISFEGVSPYKKHLHLQELPSLSRPRRGVFIVEIVGGNLSIRAVIRKGHLSFQCICVDGGHEFTVLDEDGQCLPSASIHVPKQTSSNASSSKKITTVAPNSDGKILLPYLDRLSTDEAPTDSTLPIGPTPPICRQNYPIIVSLEDFSSLGSFSYMERSYRLECGFFIDHEQLIAGSTAQLLLRPQLYVIDTPTALSLLEDVMLTIEYTYRNGITITKKVRDLELNDSRETVVDIDINRDVQMFTVCLSAEVRSNQLNEGYSPSSEKFNNKVSADYLFHVESISSTGNIYSAFLCRIAPMGEYSLSILGRNGESYANVHVRLELKHSFLRGLIQKELQSDSTGKITLGELRDISYFTLSILEQKGNYFMKFDLADQHLHSWVSTPEPLQLNLSLGDVINLPIPFTETSKNRISVIQMSEGTYLSDWTSKMLTLSTNPNPNNPNPTNLTKPNPNNPFLVHVHTKDIGDFHILLDEKVVYSLKIGQSLGESKTLNREKKDQLDDSNNNNNNNNNTEKNCEYVVQKSWKMKQSPDGSPQVIQWRMKKTPSSPLVIQSTHHEKNKLWIQLANVDKSSARVHVVFKRFIPSQSTLGGLSNPRGFDDSGHVQLKEFTSAYMNDRILSQTYQYILNRRRSADTATAGTMLPLPSLLVHPYKFKPVQSDHSGRYEALRQFCPPSACMSKSKKFGMNLENDINRPVMATDTAVFVEPSTVVVNLIPDENGLVVLPIPEKFGGGGEENEVGDSVFVEICAMNDTSLDIKALTLFSDEKSLKKKAPRIRDIRLSKSEALGNGKSHFLEYRTVYKVENSSSIVLPLSATATIQVYDCIRNAISLLNQLNSDHRRGSLPFYLGEWKKLNPMKKLSYYYRDYCDEFNFFLYKKDKEFFASIVKPLLSSKCNKGFIDSYLLEDQVTLMHYLEDFSLFNSLNIIEKTLLAQSFPQHSEAILKHLKSKLKEFSYLGIKLKDVFRTVLTSAESSEENNLNPSEEMDVENEDNSEEDEDDAAWEHVSQEEGGGGSVVQAASSFGFSAGGSRARRLCRSNHPRPSLFIPPGKTHMLREKRNRHDEQMLHPRFISPSFWIEYVEHLVAVKDSMDHQNQKPFASQYFPETGNTYTEMMFALGVLDLPFYSHTKMVKSEGNVNISSTSTSSSSSVTLDVALIYHQDIQQRDSKQNQELEQEDHINKLIITQFVFDPKESSISSGILKPAKQFLFRTVYGCQVTVSNVGSRSISNLSLLLQIPEGAIPLDEGGFYTTSLNFDLGGNENELIQYYFYFPNEGIFTTYPAHLAKDQTLIHYVQETSDIHVVQRAQHIDITSWNDVSSRGSDKDILQFLMENDLEKVDLTAIAWRVGANVGFYRQCLEILRQKMYFCKVLWGYSVIHLDIQGMRELFSNSENLLNAVGYGFCCSLVDTTNGMDFIEFSPVHLSQVAASSDERNSNSLQNQIIRMYKKLCRYLCQTVALTGLHYLAATYYLILLNRIPQALEIFSRISDLDRGSSFSIQYDYFNAFLDFYRVSNKVVELCQRLPLEAAARGIVKKYKDYPDPRWNAMFAKISEQIEELDQLHSATTPSVEVVDHPVLSVEIEDNEIILMSKKTALKSIVELYSVDIEVVFSYEPFAQQGGSISSSRISFVKPQYRFEVEISSSLSQTTCRIPSELENVPMIVKVRSESIATITKVRLCSKLGVEFFDTLGVLRVCSMGLPLAKTYVKVYSRQKEGEIGFYKDGYSDILGRFDYLSLNDTAMESIVEFAILVLHPKYGASIFHISPPDGFSS